MNFNDMKNLAKHHKQNFGRIVKCEMYRLEDNYLAISRMHDDYHDINLAMLFNEAYMVREVAVEMERIPFPQCEVQPPESVKNIIGLALYEKGVMKKVREMIPRKEGCTHLYELLESTLRAVFVGSYSVIGSGFEGALDLDLEEERQYWMSTPILQNTCSAFSTETADGKILRRAHTKMEEAEKKARIIKEVKKGNNL